MQQVAAPARAPRRRKADPAPSRWSYRFQRLMLTPFFRLALRVGVPFALSFSVGAVYLADQSRREQLQATFADMRSSIETRPEFMVKLMAVDGASEEVSAVLRDIVPVHFPISSFDLDLAAIQASVTALHPVKSAAVHIEPGGILQIDIVERETVALWRTAAGLFRLDQDGVYVGLAQARSDHPTLPILAGEHADEAVAEALSLLAAAGPLGARLKGLVRMGARRWDVVLDRDQRILLPEEGAVAALNRVIALDGVQDLFARDLSRIDMRLGARPTIKMNENAVQELWRIKTTAVETSSDD